MLFNTLDFALFLVLVVGLYHLLAHRAQNVLLLLASYWFYGAWDWRFAGLLFLSTTLDYWIGRGLGATGDARRRPARNRPRAGWRNGSRDKLQSRTGAPC
mgnify:CR=1 FL=1